MTPLRVFLADDHAIFRDGLRALLQGHEGVEVVGEAGDGHEAVAGIERTRPDVVVMDIAMPHLNGLEVTRRVRKRMPRTRVLVLSMYEDADFVNQILDAGAQRVAAVRAVCGAVDVEKAAREMKERINTRISGGKSCP